MSCKTYTTSRYNSGLTCPLTLDGGWEVFFGSGVASRGGNKFRGFFSAPIFEDWQKIPQICMEGNFDSLGRSHGGVEEGSGVWGRRTHKWHRNFQENCQTKVRLQAEMWRSECDFAAISSRELVHWPHHSTGSFTGTGGSVAYRKLKVFQRESTLLDNKVDVTALSNQHWLISV